MKMEQFLTLRAGGPAAAEAYQETIALTPEDEAAQGKLVESNVINLYPELTYQEIEGFGGAMTESAAYLLSQMDAETRRKALVQLFGKDGLRLSLMRVHIDSCDYSLEEYQAVEDPIADPELKTFSIDRDRKYILPVLKEALEVADQEISVLLSPWSPPWQWKTAPAMAKNDAAVYGGMGMGRIEDKPQRNYGGSLKPEYYGSWAKYVVKFLKAYLAEGVPVTMMTLQNETVAATNWDSCVWTPEESKIYLRDYLYPELKAEGLADKVDLFIWDHNKERMIEHVMTVLDEETLPMVAGIAFHWYSGDHFEAVSLMHDRFPDKKFMLSECCALHPPGVAGFGAPSPFGPPSFDTPASADYADAVAYGHDLIGNLNAGMNRWIDWNLAVDENGGPRHVPWGFTSGLIAHPDGSWTRPLMSYYIEHFAKYIDRGAKRIGFSRFSDAIECTAAKNPDGSLVLILLNKNAVDTGCFVRVKGTITKVSVPANSISTVVISE